MRYPPSFIERLRSHFLLSELIGRRLPLKKAGREYHGLCPFHQEKSPSFTVNNEKGFYHCFGCAAHGDAIEFVKRFENLNYREAIEKLAREAGMDLPEITPEMRVREQTYQKQQDVLEAACRWFESNLQASEHFSAREYVKSRGLKPETVARFRMGYAPDSRDALKKHLTSAGYTESQLLEAGLLARPEGSAPYDRFRGRLMFPIRNRSGKVIAFGGRLLASSTTAAVKHLPKYLNSPETDLFKKGEVLFNLDQAGKSARDRDEIVIVEGYMDVIMMAQAGVENVVATLGTAVTAEHLQILWQYAPEPTLCLDGDAAGQRAALRAADIVLPLLKPGYSLRFAMLTKGEDPDSLVRRAGVEALQGVLREARGLSETLWRHFSAQASSSPEARARLEHSLQELSEKVKDATVKNHLRAYFRTQVWKAGTSRKEPMKRIRSVELERGPVDSQASISRNVLKIILLQPALLHSAAVESHLARLDCANPTLDRLRDLLLSLQDSEASEDSERLAQCLEAEGYWHAAHALLSDENIKISHEVKTSLAAAREELEKTLHGTALADLEAEYAALIRRMEEALDEESMQQMVALQRLIKDMKMKKKSNEAPVGAD